MNKTVLIAAAAVTAATVFAAPQTARRGVGIRGGAVQPAEEAPAKPERVVIEQFPKVNRTVFAAPNIDGPTTVGRCYTRERNWIVLEAKYRTDAKWTDRLTFTWHVLLETKTATVKDKEEQAKLSQYSYFNQSVTYVNIPEGAHAAGVCLPPAYLERFGEPRAIGIVVSNAKGEVLSFGCESSITGIKAHPAKIEEAFWMDNRIMEAKDPSDMSKPMIERRQGLLDRSKTIWALVNPNDYEAVAQ